MQRLYLGIICGLIFGGIDTAMMIPLSFPDKRAAMLGAFIARFALGFVYLQHSTALARVDTRIDPRHLAKPT
jgi:hypothetical protein